MGSIKRRYEFDWLRVFATVSVFIFHCLRVFDPGMFFIKSSQPSLMATVVTSFLLQWIMPLFFVISGASIYFALRVRTTEQFLQERSKRLLIPFVCGVFILSPPQVYLERISNPNHGIGLWHNGTVFSGSFLEFLPTYFQGWYLFGGNFAWMGLHLWYLLVLFLLSLLCLPLFLKLKQEWGKQLNNQLARFLEKPGAIFLLSLPLVPLEALLDPMGLGNRLAGGWNCFIYLVFLVYGYFLVAEPRIEETVKQQWIIGLAIAAITTPFVLSKISPILFSRLTYGSSIYIVLMAIRVFNTWCWLVALIGLGIRYLKFNNQFLHYASEASLPFYMLHQPIILIFGFYVLKSEFSLVSKILVLILGSFSLTILLYEFLVRRTNTLRFLFGLKLSNN